MQPSMHIAHKYAVCVAGHKRFDLLPTQILQHVSWGIFRFDISNILPETHGVGFKKSLTLGRGGNAAQTADGQILGDPYKKKIIFYFFLTFKR